MGAPVELVAAIAVTPMASILARALSTWLIQRRSDVIVKVRGPNGQVVELNAKRVADPEKLVREVLSEPLPAVIEPDGH